MRKTQQGKDSEGLKCIIFGATNMTIALAQYKHAAEERLSG